MWQSPEWRSVEVVIFSSAVTLSVPQTASSMAEAATASNGLGYSTGASEKVPSAGSNVAATKRAKSDDELEIRLEFG